MAAGGYPASYEKGKTISGLDASTTSAAKVFHAGTAMQENNVVTNGGRVLCVVGLGHTVADARDAAYEKVENIAWDGAYYRKDIGHRAIAREET